MPTYRTIQPDTQEGRILALLESRPGQEVPAPELSRIALQYCRAINTLRKAGYVIENRTERHGRVVHGFYRLVEWRNPECLSVRKQQPSSSVPKDTNEGQNPLTNWSEGGLLFRLPARQWEDVG